MNEPAVSKISWIIRTMEKEAGKRDAPVNRIEKLTRSDPFRSLVFTILSSRTKDERTMVSTKNLLRFAPTARRLAQTPIRKIEEAIQSSGFYRIKAKNLKAMAIMLVNEFHGKVPGSRDDLVRLPGVGRKTANVVLVYAFGKDEIPVDVHVHRISNRLGLVDTDKPEETETELRRIIPKRYWKKLNHAFVAYGQTVCLPRKPACSTCKIKNLCMRAGVKQSI